MQPVSETRPPLSEAPRRGQTWAAPYFAPLCLDRWQPGPSGQPPVRLATVAPAEKAACKAPKPPDPDLEAAKAARDREKDSEEVEKIYAEIREMRRKHLAELWAIVMDTQTAIYKIWSDCYGQRVKMFEKCNDSWSKYAD